GAPGIAGRHVQTPSMHVPGAQPHCTTAPHPSSIAPQTPGMSVHEKGTHSPSSTDAPVDPVPPSESPGPDVSPVLPAVGRPAVDPPEPGSDPDWASWPGVASGSGSVSAP